MCGIGPRHSEGFLISRIKMSVPQNDGSRLEEEPFAYQETNSYPERFEPVPSVMIVYLKASQTIIGMPDIGI